MRSILPLLVLACLAFGCDKSAQGAASSSASTPAASPAAAAPSVDDSVAQSDDADAERYPQLNFHLLSAPDRARFIRLAEAEICPCGSMVSLDACLQTEEVCLLGLQAGAQMMVMVHEAAPDAAITDGIQQFIENARKVWTFNLDDVPWVGAENPKVTIVNFSDFECPHCREFGRVLDQVLERHGDTVRVYFKQFPLGGRPAATAAAIGALAAHRQGQFHRFHNAIYERQALLSSTTDVPGLVSAVASELGLNMDRFVQDANDPQLQAMVNRDRAEGTEAGVDSTPTFFVNGVRNMDAYSVDALSQTIEALIQGE